MPPAAAISRSSLALDNLRGVVILIVLAFHSALAYVSWNPATTTAFGEPPYAWRAFPIVDGHRFFGFDLFCAWQDVYLMALMFFLSGLFVLPSLTRKKEWGFLRDRLLRIGLPYAFGIAIVIPIAIYPAYRVRSGDTSVLDYWKALLDLPFWVNGPLWFLWQLLALNIIAAALNRIASKPIEALGRWSVAAGDRPVPYFAVLFAASALAYVPLAVIFTPWTWSNSGIFAVQFCRPLLYAVYFFAGVGIGAQGIDRGLVAADGVLSRNWALWLAAALTSLLLWMGLTALTMNDGASVWLEIAADFSFVPACATGCFFLVAASLRFGVKRSRMLRSLAANAYGIYLLHYMFVVWLQFALLAMPLFALFKAAIVFCGALTGTWTIVIALQRVPFGARLIGSQRPSVAELAPSVLP